MNDYAALLAQLGPSAEDKAAARQQAIMRAGMGILAASGPSRLPQGLGGILAQGGMQGMDTYNTDLQRLTGERRTQALMAKGLAEEQQKQKDSAALAQALSGPNAIQSLGQAIPNMGVGMQPAALNALIGAQTRQDTREFQRGESETARQFRVDEADKGRQLQRELVQLRADVGGDRPFFQFLQTPEGYVAGNARSGTVSPVTLNNQRVMPAQASPQLQGDIAAAKAGGKEGATARVQAQVDLPRVIDNANNASQLIDQMVGSEDGRVKKHPGFQTSVGLGLGPLTKRIPGTDAAGFHALLDQVKGGAFLEAFNSLKGGGQITEVEGKKATDAITRMQTATKESEFVAAAREYQKIIRLGVDRAQKKAGVYSGPERRVPAGVDPALWQIMTPEEKAAFAQ